MSLKIIKRYCVVFLLLLLSTSIQKAQAQESAIAVIPNFVPVVNPGSNQTISLPQTVLTLNGSATDSAGTIVSYQWTRRYGSSSVVMTNANTQNLSLSNLIMGGYGFRLTATNNSGATGYADVKVTVMPNPAVSCTEGQYLSTFNYDNSTFRAWLHIPTGFCSNSSQYPLVVFHHGDGQKGTDPHLLLQPDANGTPSQYFNDRVFDPNMVVISPQLDFVRSDGDPWIAWNMGWNDKIIEHVQTLYPNRIDDNKVHITGLSGGSGRTILYAKVKASRLATFSTVAYVCVGTIGISNADYNYMGKTASWLFQNFNDATGCFTGLRDGLQNNTPIYPPLYTVYNDSGHGGWAKAYSNNLTYSNVQSTNANSATYPTIWDWMKSKTRTTLGTATATATASPTPTRTNTPVPIRTDTIGVFKDGVWSLRNSNNAGTADITASFGAVGDLPVAGDWNGDSVDTIGVYRSSAGVYSLSNSNTSPSVAYTLTFGNPGDAPIAGRWTSDMNHDGVGVYRNSNGILYQKKDLTTGFSDFFAIFGNPGDQGVSGDFDGNGFDSIGVYRPSNQTWFLTNNSQPNGITFGDLSFVWSTSSGTPLFGDWNGDGISTPGYLSNTGSFMLHSANAAAGTDMVFVFGPANAPPIAGKWITPVQPTTTLLNGTGGFSTQTSERNSGD